MERLEAEVYLNMINKMFHLFHLVVTIILELLSSSRCGKQFYVVDVCTWDTTSTNQNVGIESFV